MPSRTGRAVGELNVQDRVAGLEIDVLHAAGIAWIQVPRDLASPEVENLDPFSCQLANQRSSLLKRLRMTPRNLFRMERSAHLTTVNVRTSVPASDSSRISNRPRDGVKVRDCNANNTGRFSAAGVFETLIRHNCLQDEDDG